MTKGQSISIVTYLKINTVLWILLLLLETFQSYSLTFVTNGNANIGIILSNTFSFYGTLWILAFPVFLLWKRTIGFSITQIVVLHLIAALLIGLIHLLAYRFLFYNLVTTYGWIRFEMTLPQLMKNVLFNRYPELIRSSLMYGLLIVVLFALSYYKRYRDEVVYTANLESQLATSQLDALKMQLQPHFFFNVLNTVSMLIRNGRYDKALEMVTGLGTIFRITLQKREAAFVSLKEEMDLIKHYLEIEAVRFEDRLSIDYQVDPKVLSLKIPSLILLPVVENAIKHGISNTMKKVLLKISAYKENKYLTILVYNEGPPLPEAFDIRESRFMGVGIQNTMERLSQLSESTHFDIYNKSNGVEVLIQIPVRYETGTINESDQHINRG